MPSSIITLFFGLMLSALYAFGSFGFLPKKRGWTIELWAWEAVVSYTILIAIGVVVWELLIALIPGGYEFEQQIIRSGFLEHAVWLLAFLTPIQLRNRLLIVKCKSALDKSAKDPLSD